MVELDLSFLSLLALAFAVGCVAGFLLRGLRLRRIEDMLQFFRQRDQEQDRKIANQEREISDARGRLLSMKADQAKAEKAAGDLRTAFDEAQRTITRLREELAIRPPAPLAPPEEPLAPAADESAAAPPVNVAAAAPAPVAKAATTTPPAAPVTPGSGSSAKAPFDGGKKTAKKGRLP